MIARMIAAYLRGRRGSAAAEFALVLPATLFFTLGAFNLSVLVYATSAMNRAAEAAARYWSVQTALNGADPGATAVSAWASSQYAGPTVSAAFTYDSVRVRSRRQRHRHLPTGRRSRRHPPPWAPAPASPSGPLFLSA